MMHFSTTIRLSLLALGFAVSARSEIEPAGLRCEYLDEAFGLTELHPRLSWKSTSAERAQTQSAYRVIVGSSREVVERGAGNLWDTGIQRSHAQTEITYQGRPLSSSEACYWRVMLWDGTGRPSQWSQVATWTTGLLRVEDWKAQWLSAENVFPDRINARSGGFLSGAKWIWTPATGNDAAASARFRRTIDVPSGPVDAAPLIVAASGAYEVSVNGRKILTRGEDEDSDRAKLIDVKQALHTGANVLEVGVKNRSGRTPGLLAHLEVKATDGQHVVESDHTWEVIEPVGAEHAVERGQYGDARWGRVTINYVDEYLPPAAYFRKRVAIVRPVRRAVIYSTARGIYTLHVNGSRIGRDLLAPGWTDYGQRIHVQAYDVTAALRNGENAIAVVLADGWYTGYVGCKGQRSYYNTLPQFLGQMNIEYKDGTQETVATDASWRCSSGEIREADLLRGTTVDLHRAKPGWMLPAYDDRDWAPVRTEPRDGTRLEASPAPPVRVIAEFKPVSLSEPKRGVHVFNLGQNFAGVVRLRTNAKAGDRIQLRYAERLNPDGTIYTANLRTARATDTLICAEPGPVDWTPEFTFHGFQYVELTGGSAVPDVGTITGLAISSDTPRTGSFTSSNRLLNQIYSNIYWTQRMNFIDIPTDCPQRDERQGWTGDAQVYVRAATANTDVQSFFEKWLTDLADEQFPDGEYPCTAPLPFFGGGGAAWADAGIVCPWTIYDAYGDKTLLVRQYASMRRYIENRRRWFSDDFKVVGGGCIGDWLNIDDNTPTDVLVACYTAHSFDLMSRMADALGKADDRDKYRAWFAGVSRRFALDYVDEHGAVKGNSQTGCALPIAFGMLNDKTQALVGHHLVSLIEGRGWNLSTGFLGTQNLMAALSKIGRSDVAYRLLTNETFPSWGFSIRNGATTIWERWNGWTPEKGFFDPSMNSFAHYSFGAVYEWMFNQIGGIRSLRPGFKQFRVSPQIDSRVTHATTSYVSPYGEMLSEWSTQPGEFRLKLRVPCNASAVIDLPANRASTISEGALPIDASPGVKVIRRDENQAELAVGSGEYEFIVRGG